MSRATCQNNRTRGVVEVVDDEPRDVLRHPTRSVGEVVDDEPRDKPRDEPWHPDARCRRS
jgi:hypothetical protein